MDLPGERWAHGCKNWSNMGVAKKDGTSYIDLWDWAPRCPYVPIRNGSTKSKGLTNLFHFHWHLGFHEQLKDLQGGDAQRRHILSPADMPQSMPASEVASYQWLRI